MADGIHTRLSPAEGRRFGLVTGGAFLGLGALLAWRGHLVPALAAGALGAFFVLGGLVFPARMGPVHRGWMAFALALSRVTTPVILGIVYFGVITPMALARRGWLRIRGRRALPPADLWVARERAGLDRRSDLTRQF